MFIRLWHFALVLGALAVALVACAPIPVNPIPNPAALGFEALPPPTEVGALLPAQSDDAPQTTIFFTSGEECMWIGGEPTTLGNELTDYHCNLWQQGESSIVALGPLESVQGLSFQAQRVVAAPVDGRLHVVSSTPLPFNILQVVLGDGTVCTSAGERTNEIIDNRRISFGCDAPAFGDPPGGINTRLVLLNGLYPGDDGIFTIDAGTLAGDVVSGTLSNVERLSVANLVAQPLIVSVSAEENGKTIYLSPAQILEVTLDSNPTTGYSWALSDGSTVPLSFAGEPEYIAPNDDRLGAGGIEVLRFDVADFGSGELQLDYVRSFEKDAQPAETFHLNVIVVATTAENGSSVTLPVGEALAVDLPGNPSTGYQWQVVDNDGQILAQTSDPVTISPFAMPGAGGIQRFTFEGVAQGTMTLNMRYVRPWEPEAEPASIFTLGVTVK